MNEDRTPRPTHWLRLFRPPNLFSVPGDPAAGFLLAGGGSPMTLACICASSLFIYMYGLVANDIADIEEDAKERPWRPLASGGISVSHARIAAAIMAMLGIGAAALAGSAAFVVALSLAGLVSLYSFSRPFRRLLGSGALGLCRAMSVCLGIVAAKQYADSLLPWLLALSSLIYVSGLSMAAVDETKLLSGGRPGRNIFLFGALMWGFVSVAASAQRLSKGYGLFNFACIAIAAGASLLMLRRVFLVHHAFGRELEPSKVQASIGALIGGLIFGQASACAASGSMIIAAILLALAPLSRIVARRFYGS